MEKIAEYYNTHYKEYYPFRSYLITNLSDVVLDDGVVFVIDTINNIRNVLYKHYMFGTIHHICKFHFAFMTSDSSDELTKEFTDIIHEFNNMKDRVYITENYIDKLNIIRQFFHIDESYYICCNTYNIYKIQMHIFNSDGNLIL